MSKKYTKLQYAALRIRMEFLGCKSVVQSNGVEFDIVRFTSRGVYLIRSKYGVAHIDSKSRVSLTAGTEEEFVNAVCQYFDTSASELFVDCR